MSYQRASQRGHSMPTAISIAMAFAFVPAAAVEADGQAARATDDAAVPGAPELPAVTVKATKRDQPLRTLNGAAVLV